MGLRDDVWGIKRSIDQQAQSSANKSIQKYKIENDLLIKLEYYIRKYKDHAQDVYNVTVQDEIITTTLRAQFGDLQSQLDHSNPAQFVENYKTQDEQVDEDYYYIYCMRHYLSACRNVENYIKMQAGKEKVTREQIQNDILAIKKEQEGEKLRRLQGTQKEQIQNEILLIKKAQEAEKLKKLQQNKPVARTSLKGSGDAVASLLKIGLFLFLGPFAIIGLILYGFFSCAAKSVK